MALTAEQVRQQLQQLKTAKVIREVEAERDRQVALGYDATHDDKYSDGSIARCAAWILICCQVGGNSDWAFDRAVHIVKKHDYRKRLEIAAAMLIAEMERIDRLPKEEKGTTK